MSAGRGTPRFAPVNGTPYPADRGGQYLSVPGNWGVFYGNGGPQEATSEYALYRDSDNQFQFPVPYGTTRVGLHLEYAPGANNGVLAIQAQWYSGSQLFYSLDMESGNAVVAPTEDPMVSEQPMSATAYRTPPMQVDPTELHRFVVPFYVPSIIPFNIGPAPDPNLLTYPVLEFRLRIREAGGVDPGTFTMLGYMAESFGIPPVVSTR